MTIVISATGPLFEGSPSKKMRSLVNKVLHEAGREQLSIYKGMTPVDTGRLQQGWSQRVSRGSVELYNDVPYGQYVFARMDLIGRTENALSDLIADSLNREINKGFG